MRFNADLYRIACMTASREDTRYYLNGVFVERHPTAGAVLVAIDGHRMTVIHDESATLDAGEPNKIVRLSADALKACRAKHKESRRVVEFNIDGDAFVISETDYTQATGGTRRNTLAKSPAAIVDGTFPAWRRVCPVEGKAIAPAAFASHYLAAYGDIGTELARAMRKPKAHPATQVYSTQQNGPALVRWFGIDHAFGVIMPCRSFDDLDAVTLPAWLNPPAVARSN